MTARSVRRAKPVKRERVHAPRASYEELEIHTRDGMALGAVLDDPPDGVPLVGTCGLAHAMFARRSAFGRRDRPGLAHALGREGWRTIAFDFRGHGESKVDREWSYDDLVRLDLPAVTEAARAHGDDKPVVIAGHSLGGHVALAAQGTGTMQADGVVAIAANVWLRALEPSRARWAAKLAIARATLATVNRVGRFPARALRLGSDDESATYMRDLMRAPLENAWCSADGATDYVEALANVKIPVAAIVSEGDRINCHPACGDRFVRACGGPVLVSRIACADDGGKAPDHMQLVTTLAARTPIVAALAWIRSKL